ncbi:hypothetical protein UFOVP449_64 [uncultured Caudovirales phage]|uniref:Uncharacterized protein n=1 Tax=uncultured Caudovirales phage TaxID=2100421 RepID=A0A6J5MFY8_9CAUD|nr:hypothetical protein UFOVP449_64 [uncultured Caudovirales phage]
MADGLEIFLASVKKVLISSEDFLDLKTNTDYIKIYNKNENFASKDVRFLGAIKFARNTPKLIENYAFPFDKNNMTFPIQGETVMVIKNSDEYFWLPYTIGQYPNYREDYKTSEATSERDIPKSTNDSKQKDYKESKNTPNSKGNQKESDKSEYIVKDKIKFLKPNEGDTILQGRVGNTIRLSESFLVNEENPKEPSPSIIIRNRQNTELDGKKIGELVEEDINKDGSSIYIVSKNAKVPYKHTTIEKEKVAFKEYPTDNKLSGDQIYINSDRILLSAKANEFIIFGKKNTGVITDGNFSVDAKKDIYLHNEKNITIHSKGNNKIFINSDSGGKIYLGKDSGEGDAGAAVQKMVLGGELVKILGDIIDAINQQMYLTPSGPTSTGPTNAAQFSSIKSRLKTLLSARNFLSKS